MGLLPILFYRFEIIRVIQIVVTLRTAGKYE